MSNPHCWPSHIRGHVYPDLVSRWESVVGYLRASILLLSKILNLVPRAHMPFGQHQDTELWNNQFPETKILVVPVSRHMRALV